MWNLRVATATACADLMGGGREALPGGPQLSESVVSPLVKLLLLEICTEEVFKNSHIALLELVLLFS